MNAFKRAGFVGMWIRFTNMGLWSHEVDGLTRTNVPRAMENSSHFPDTFQREQSGNATAEDLGKSEVDLN